MVASNLHIVTQPQEYFKEQVSQARAKLKLSLDEEIEFYVVNLLSEFVFSSTLSTKEEGEGDVFSTPLAMLLKNALESPPEKQTGIFKKMGDSSLYVAGYFQDYFNRKAFNLSYYITMGQSAFENLSELMKHQFSDPHFAEIYCEISHKFNDLVELLATVSEIPASGNNTHNLLSIYDRWNQTKSERLRKILEENGIEAIPVSRKAQ